MSEKKDTNPKDAVGTAKVPLSTVPARVVAELGLALLEGARRYGRHNYRVAGVRASVYYDAFMRHSMAFWEGQDIDPASGIHHLSKAMACVAVLLDSIHQGNWTDDRPPKTPEGWVEELNAKAAALIAKYPEAVPAHTALTPETQTYTGVLRDGVGVITLCHGDDLMQQKYEALIQERDCR